MTGFIKFQIGKSGLTQGVIDSLNVNLKNHSQIRISVLKSSGRTRESMKEMAEKISEGLEYECASRVIGFTIIITRLKKRNK